MRLLSRRQWRLLANEVDTVVRSVRVSGLFVSAVHNHFATESPRLIFVHVAGVGNTSQITTGLGNAMRLINNTGTSSTSGR